MKVQFKSIIRSLIRNQGGFTLAETIVGLTLILIVSVGSVGLFSRALQMSGGTKHITAATYIAKSHMEEIKTTDFGYITSLFPAGVPYSITDPSLPSGATWMVTYPDEAGNNILKIVVTVSWPEESETQSIQLATLVVAT